MELKPKFNRLAQAGALAGGVATLAACSGHNEAKTIPKESANSEREHIYADGETIPITKGMEATIKLGHLIVFKDLDLENFRLKYGRSKFTATLKNVDGLHYVSVQYGQAIGKGDVMPVKGGAALDCLPKTGNICDVEVVRTNIPVGGKPHTTTTEIKVANTEPTS